MWRRAFTMTTGVGLALATAVTAWIAVPVDAGLRLPAPLQAWVGDHLASTAVPYTKDFVALSNAFRPQAYRSFCGPASIATVLRAYGVKRADQSTVFPSLLWKVDAFYTGMSLAQVAALAESNGLRTETVYANTLSLNTFRERLKSNLNRAGDFVIVNYDRRTLKQSGTGHISVVGAYDPARDAFLVLDQADFKYPFTWIPAPLLYQAVHTRAGERFRGVLFIHAYEGG